ncbi:MAG: TrmH family RNA methyltransferase [Actinomycetota bacterium]
MITSTANPLVKDLLRLRNRRERDLRGQFLIEGRRPLLRAVEGGAEVVQQVVCRDMGGRPLADIPVVEMGEAPFRRLSLRQSPDGVLGVAAHLDTSLARLRVSAQPLVLVVESLEKPGNLGAVLRTCDGLGVDALVVADPATDAHNPNVVQASQGALFTVPLGVGSGPEVRRWLEERGIRLLATTPEGGLPPWDADLAGSVAIAIGSEAAGLGPAMVSAADATVTIPMQGRVDSLNASVTAGVVAYEAVRQRQG